MAQILKKNSRDPETFDTFIFVNGSFNTKIYVLFVTDQSNHSALGSTPVFGHCVVLLTYCHESMPVLSDN